MKKYTYLLVFFTLIGNIKAQDYLSFYNLKDYVIQTQNLSPIFLPKYSVSFGTPANIGLDINSDFKISDILVESGNNLSIDLDNLNALAQESNAVHANVANNLFMLGFKLKKGSITVFANTKTNLLWEFSDSFTNVAANGFGSSFALSNEKLRISSYSEIGIGFTQQFFKEKLTFGIRLKSLNGIAHGEIKEGASFAADINNTNFNWAITSSNATVNTSNLSNLSDDEFNFFTENSGFGVDLGLNYKITDKLTVEVAVNDLGSIDWKENVTNYNIDDNNGTVYQGFDFEGADDVVEEIETAFGDVIGSNETNEAFTTQLGTKMFISAKYQISEKNAFQAVYFSDNNPYIDVEPSYSLGYNRTLNKSTYGLTAGAGGVNSDFRFGANLAVQLAFLQLYAAIDDFSSIGGKVQDVRSTNLRFGINFLFGYKRKHSSFDDVEDEDF